MISELKRIAQDAKDTTPTDAFCDQVGAAFAGVPDSHLSILKGKTSCGRQERRSGPGVGNNLARGRPTSPRAWTLDYRSAGAKKVPVLALGSLPVIEDPAWAGFFEKVRELKRTAPAIVIDLRGLSGGSSNAGLKLAEILYGARVPSPINTHVTSQTPESLALRVNSYVRKIHQAKVNGEAVSAFLDKKWAQARGRLREASLNGAAHKGLAQEWVTEDGEQGAGFDPKLGFARPIGGDALDAALRPPLS